MGGHALKNTYTERKNTEEFLRIGKEIQNNLSFETVILKCYENKISHGDLDLLIKVFPNANINWKHLIEIIFKPNEIFSNGGVYSFDYQNFQIDFIPIEENKWGTAQLYGNYDPLSNIMGKTFHKFGLSYGWDGLHYKYRNLHGTNSENILLTTDARKIFDFGGYDYDRYLKGFDNLEDIFQFVINGKYFDAEMFQMENLKSLDKKRNRKRGSYHLFLNYLKDNNINKRYSFAEDKNWYLETINLCFPDVDLIKKIEALKLKDLKNKQLSDKFNGKIIMEWIPDIQGKELGNAIHGFIEYIGADLYEGFILNGSIEEIRLNFMIFYHGKK